MHIQVNGDGRIVGIRDGEPPDADAGIWRESPSELGDDFADYRLVGGVLAHDPPAAPLPPSAEQVVAAIIESEPALTDKLPGAIVGRLGSWFDEWSGDGVGYVAGKLLNRSGVLYRVLQGHTSQPDWTPESAPSLFARVLTDPGGDILPWEQPGSTNPYMRGDRVTFDGKTYESLIDNNVWSPDGYPAGWREN